MMRRLPRLLPRLPCDLWPPRLLAPGQWTLDPDQTCEEAEEVAAYLAGWLALVDAQQGHNRRIQVFHSKGEQN